jgi:hypothetical protein
MTALPVRSPIGVDRMTGRSSTGHFRSASGQLLASGHGQRPTARCPMATEVSQGWYSRSLRVFLLWPEASGHVPVNPMNVFDSTRSNVPALVVYHATSGDPARVLPDARERLRALVMARDWDMALLAGRERAERFHIVSFELDGDLLAQSCRTPSGVPPCGIYRVPSWLIPDDALVAVQEAS